jgi:hypothetical protein
VVDILGLPISYLIFAGDMLVMAFMVAVVVWVSIRANDEQIDAAARIPLDDGAPVSGVPAARSRESC